MACRRQAAITGDNVEPDLCRSTAYLGYIYNELIQINKYR